LNIVKDASLCTLSLLSEFLKKGKQDLFKEIMDYEYYDVNFILKLILLFKKKNIAFTDDELTNYFYNNNKGIIKINERYNNTFLSL